MSNILYKEWKQASIHTLYRDESKHQSHERQLKHLWTENFPGSDTGPVLARPDQLWMPKMVRPDQITLTKIGPAGPNFAPDWFWRYRKNLTKLENQELDGDGIIDLAGQGSVYLLQKVSKKHYYFVMC